MEIDALRSDDLPFLKELQPEGWPDIIPHMQFYLDTPYCFPVKLTLDKKIVGIGSTLIHPEVAWLAHIIVHPGYWNRGFGKIITQSLLDSLKSSSVETIMLVSTELGKPVYKKLGFVIDSEYSFFKGGSVDSNVPVNEHIIPIEKKHEQQILQLDLNASGEDRSIRLQEHLKNGFAIMEDERVRGFYLPTLVEGLILATDHSAGLELMKLRLQKNEIAVLPDENETGVDFLIRHQYKKYRVGTRMRLGKKRTWNPSIIYNRVSGQIG